MTISEKFYKIMKNVFSEYDIDIMDTILSLMGFFSAPASTKFHGAYDGGLFDHSLAVTEALLKITDKMNLTWGREISPYIVGMFHDLCKCDNYVKTENGYEHNKNLTLNGHGEKSAILVQRVLPSNIKITEEELLCIRWHMGAFDDKSNWSNYNAAVKLYPNVLWTHTADMIASQIESI